MLRVIRRALGAGALALLLAAAVTTAATPEGPRLAVVKTTAKSYRLELLTVGPTGDRPLRLAVRDANPRMLMVFSALSWSPDGEHGVFTGIVGSRHEDDHELLLRLFIVRADGSGLRVIRGTSGANAPVFSPDGRTVAFNRLVDRETPTTVGGKRREEFHGASIWTVDLLTGAQRQLTPWRDGVYYAASSFSPDGSTLLATHEDNSLLNAPEPVALKLDGSGSRRLLEVGMSPVYSPDGSEIALIRNTAYGEGREETTDLYVIRADGTDVRRLTRTPGRSEYSPSWDPSGERLAYARSPVAGSEYAPPGLLPNELMQINADGTCQTTLLSAPGTAFSAPAWFSAPTWQPGPGRGAGRIEC
ncbi:MAG TPA: hypothetical protein VMS60_11845 [Solirubrobacterales bacterium]|nr:hypothetical protein [Solirubrobacterales bacterium]